MFIFFRELKFLKKRIIRLVIKYFHLNIMNRQILIVEYFLDIGQHRARNIYFLSQGKLHNLVLIVNYSRFVI